MDQSMFSLSRIRPGVTTSPRKGERRSARGCPAAARQNARSLLHTSAPDRSRSRSASCSQGSGGRSGSLPKSAWIARFLFRRQVHGMDVHRHAGAGQPEHDVIAIEQLRDR
jgi:hypothetical protein